MVGSELPRPRSIEGARRERLSTRPTLALTAAALAFGALALGALSACSADPGPTAASASATASASARTSVDAADVCAQAAALTDAGAPRDALELIDVLRAGEPAPAPSPQPTRRTLIPSTPTPEATPIPVCEPERLAAVAALGDRLVPTAAPAPSAAEEFGNGWDAVVSRGIAPLLPAALTAILGIALLAGLAALLRRFRPRASVGAARRRRVGLAATVLAPLLLALTLPVAWPVGTALFAALGIGGAVLLARRDAPAPTIRLRVTDEDRPGSRPAEEAALLARVGGLVAEGYASATTPLDVDDRGVVRWKGVELTADVPADAPADARARFVSLRFVSLQRGPRATLVTAAPDGRPVAVAVEPAALRRALRAADVDPAGLDLDDLLTDLDAAALLVALDAGSPANATRDRALSVVLQRLAERTPPAALAIREVARRLDPADVRLAAASEPDAAWPVEEEGLREALRVTRHRIDAALLTDGDTARARPGWTSFATAQLGRALAIALDLRALTGVPADERTDRDARLLVATLADSEHEQGGPPSTAQMLAGVRFCELFPEERANDSPAARWAAAALDDEDPDVAFAVAVSFSAGWRDDMAPYLKRDIELRIADRLRFALPLDRLRARALVDPVLRRHATHPWYLELVESDTAHS